MKIFENGILRDPTPEEIIQRQKDQEEARVNLIYLMREKRNLLIASTDWTQAADIPQALKDKWAPYRQALRDVPQQPGFPNDITWPIKPE